MYCMAYLSPFRAVRSVVPLQARGLLAPQVRQFSYRSQNYYQGSWGKKRNFIYPGIAALTATGVLISSRDDMTISKGRKIEVASSTANKEGSHHTGSSTDEMMIILVINFLLILYKVFEKNILSVSAERQKELETQENITSLTLQLREKDQQIEKLKRQIKGT